MLNADVPFIIIGNADVYIDVVKRQQVGDTFGPLDKTIFAAVQVLLKAHVQSFGLGFKAVKIEMENIGLSTDVFVHNRESWACNIIVTAQLLAQGFYQRSFTGTHITVKKENAAVGSEGDNL